MFRMQFLHLFNTENLSELKHLLINFLRFRQGSSNTVAFNTSLSPSHDLRTLSFHRKITTFLECIEPTVEWDKSYVLCQHYILPLFQTVSWCINAFKSNRFSQMWTKQTGINRIRIAFVAQLLLTRSKSACSLG